MLLLLVLSAFFSGSETALFSLTPETARRVAVHKRINRLLIVLREDSAELLTAILFGNLVVNVLFFCTGAAATVRWGGDRGGVFEAIGGVLILIALTLFGEIIPKAFGVTHPAAVLLFTASPLRLWFSFSRPVRRGTALLLKWMKLGESSARRNADLSPGEFKELLKSIEHEPGFGSSEKVILEDIVDLSDVRIREVMVPRVEVFCSPADAVPEYLIEQARRKKAARIVIYGDREDDLLGYIHVKDLVFNSGRRDLVRSVLHPLTYVPETKRADDLLRELMIRDWPMVAVVDEYGGLSGIVTIEDLFSEIIGDLDEGERASIQQVDECTYRLEGRLSIREWRELFTGVLPGAQIETMAFDTLGGLIVSLLGRVPYSGDQVTVRNLRLTVESMHRRRVGTVLLERLYREDAS